MPSKSPQQLKEQNRQNTGIRIAEKVAGRKIKAVKNSLMLALAKLKQNKVGRVKGKQEEQSDNYAEIFDEINCYIERTLQLLWLFYKIGIFTQS